MNSLTNLKKSDGHAKGFTLLELLIVIAIIAILSIALVFMLNPAETLKKSRDAQRISDLKTVKTALGIMLTASSTPSLDNFGTGIGTTAVCVTNTAGTARAGMIAYSIDSATAPDWAVAPVHPAVTDAVSGATYGTSGYVRTGAVGKVDGTGWIPVNLKMLTGGTPIASFPIDPVNTISGTDPASTDYVYRYACQNGSVATGKPSFIFEINTVLESSAYAVEENKDAKDGGDNDSYYETGNSLNLLPSTTTF